MSVLEKNNELQGDLGETIFKHFCNNRQYAYIKLEKIYNTFTPDNKLIFNYGFNRVEVTIPDKICEEIRETCMPSNKNNNSPSFKVDFLTVAMRYDFTSQEGTWVHPPDLRISAFKWVEIKTGNGRLTKNQRDFIKKEGGKITRKIFRIHAEFPEQFEIKEESI